MNRALVECLVVVGLALLVAWCLPDLLAWARTWSWAQTDKPAGTAWKLPVPSEGETLVVLFVREGDELKLRGTFFAGSRGTYSKKPRPTHAAAE